MSLHLQTNFPGGNACAIDVQQAPDRDIIYFAADPRGHTDALWFYFRVDECSERPVEVILTNLDTCHGGQSEHWQRVRPVIRQAGATWERLPGARVETLDDGRHQAAWTVVPRYGSFECALCYPYGLGDLEIARAACGRYWHLAPIGVTSSGQPLPRLSNIGSAKQTPGLYLVARQQAAETPGSWVLDGLLRRAATGLDPTDLLIWTTPFADPDAALTAAQTSPLLPAAIHQTWTIPPHRHETRVIQSDLDRWAQRAKPTLVVDFHAPEPTEAGGAYFTLPHCERPTPSLAAAHNAIDAIAPALPNALLHTRPTRQPNPPLAGEINATLDAYVWDHFEIPTLLLNIPYTTSHHTLFTRQEYQRLGATLLQGICAHLQVPLAG